MPRGVWKILTKEEEKFIIDNYLELPVKQIARELDITFGRVMRVIERNGLVIPKALIRKRKKDSCFKKGQTSFNKGKKQSDYMSEESIKRTKRTRFKKGNKPYNLNYNGHERISKDGYIEVRIRKGKYQLKHRVEWEKIHGEIPKDYNVVFKDGNPLNVEINNLELISREEHMLRNSKHDIPKEVIPSMAILSKLKKQINGKKQND